MTGQIELMSRAVGVDAARRHAITGAAGVLLHKEEVTGETAK